MTARMRFIGVSTGASSINRIFPVWAELLGIDAELSGLDVPLQAAPEVYRAALQSMIDDPACAGALVTTHKIAVLEAARSMFAELDPFATAVGEVSSISVRDGQLFGAAKDPLTADLAMRDFLAPGHFTVPEHRGSVTWPAPGSAEAPQVLCLGAGGAGAAIAWALAHREDPPEQMMFVDVAATRLTHLEELVGTIGGRVDIATTDQIDLTSAVAGLPPGSVVINATGLGKDRPGSPLAPEVEFAPGTICWELNYRGELDFLHQALAQQSRGVRVVDGWDYFIHGWTQVIAEVFDLPMPADLVRRLAAAAREVR